MIERTLAKRYASALLSAAKKAGKTEEIGAFLTSLREAYDRSALVRTVLRQPRLSRMERKRLLRTPFEKAAPRPFLEFLDLLVEKNRVNLVPEIAEAYTVLADALAGMVRIQVRSFLPLSKPQEASLEEKLRQKTQKKVILEAQTDASLKGGMLVRIGDNVIDGSVSRRLQALAERFSELQRR